MTAASVRNDPARELTQEERSCSFLNIRYLQPRVKLQKENTHEESIIGTPRGSFYRESVLTLLPEHSHTGSPERTEGGKTCQDSHRRETG